MSYNKRNRSLSGSRSEAVRIYNQRRRINQLEEDYKNEVEENLKLSELWRKSQEKVNQLETNINEAIEYINTLIEILRRGKHDNN